MRTATVLLGACVLLAFQSGVATAQQCKSEIENVAKLLASRDAGTGPTTGMATHSTPGSPSQQRGPDGQPKQQPPTSTMGQATAGGATSPQDVQAQTRGEPTAAQKAEGAQQPEAAQKLRSAQAALQRAREFDRNGQEAQCLSAISEAKQLAK